MVQVHWGRIEKYIISLVSIFDLAYVVTIDFKMLCLYDQILTVQSVLNKKEHIVLMLCVQKRGIVALRASNIAPGENKKSSLTNQSTYQ